MAKKPNEVGRAASGLFFLNVGYTASGSQKKFYLGRDERKAVTAKAQLERLWGAVLVRFERQKGIIRLRHQDGSRTTEGPAEWAVWDDVTLAIARAIIDERAIAYVAAPTTTTAGRMGWLKQLREDVPFIRIDLDDADAAEQVVECAEARASELRASARELARSVGNQTMHPALLAYRKYVEEKYTEHGTLSAWGTTQTGIVDFLVKHLPDLPLEKLDMLGIESCLDVIRKRPLAVTRSAKGQKPISIKYATNAIKQFRNFIRWLHRSSEWEWEKPRDYEVLPVRVVKTEAERRGNHAQVKTYSIDELVTIWKYATPRVRAMMALALNCAFGGGEIATLLAEEALIDQRHPYAEQLDLSSSEEIGSWIMRNRRKTEVYGEWRLWSVSVQAIRWALAQKGDSELPHVFLTNKGVPLDKATVANNKNAKIQNLWNKTIERIQKDLPEFQQLSFNKLRKTASNFVRHEAGPEVASLMLAHGESYAGDDLLDVYTNRPFAKLHSALRLVEARLQRVWDAVADPFPAGPEKRGGPNISQATIRKILDMHTTGWKPPAIAEKLDLSAETVRRWIKRGNP
jgi:hypothetical protein